MWILPWIHYGQTTGFWKHYFGTAPNAKNEDGRKRHIVVDSMGLLLAVLVTAADVDDARAAAELFRRLEGQPMGKVVRMNADF